MKTSKITVIVLFILCYGIARGSDLSIKSNLVLENKVYIEKDKAGNNVAIVPWKLNILYDGPPHSALIIPVIVKGDNIRLMTNPDIRIYDSNNVEIPVFYPTGNPPGYAEIYLYPRGTIALGPEEKTCLSDVHPGQYKIIISQGLNDTSGHDHVIEARGEFTVIENK